MSNVTTIYQTAVDGANPALTKTAAAGLSPLYKHINTEDIETVFLDHGFTLDNRSYGVPRKENLRGFQKHISIFSRPDLKIGDDNLQLLLTNAHNGKSALRLDVGVFRAVCANGMVCGDPNTSFQVRHVGDVQSRIDEGIKYLLERMPQVAANVETMKNTELSRLDILGLQQDALLARTGQLVCWDDFRKVVPRRNEDIGTDLWRVYNTIQEHMIKGGFIYKDAKGWHKTRKISAVDRTIKMNKELWNAATDLIEVA